MSDSKHTPGPWTCGNHNGLVRVFPKGSTSPVCGVHRRGIYSFGEDSAETAANARLIAAAPDLLAALRAFVDPDNAPFITECDAVAVKMMADARAAVAKAEGRKPKPTETLSVQNPDALKFRQGH